MVSPCYTLNINSFQIEDLTLIVHLCMTYVIKYKEAYRYFGSDVVMWCTWLSNEGLKPCEYWEFQILIGRCQFYNHGGYRRMKLSVIQGNGLQYGLRQKAVLKRLREDYLLRWYESKSKTSQEVCNLDMCVLRYHSL